MLDVQLFERMKAFSQAVDNVNSIEALNALMKTEAEKVGITMFCYRHLPPVGALDYTKSHLMMSYGFPDSWTEFYRDNKLCTHDPLLDPVIELNRPLTWSELIVLSHKTDLAKEYAARAEKFDIGTGLALPVYGAYSRGGVFSVTFDKTCTGINEAQTSVLHWACQTAHTRYIDMITEKPEMNAELTGREIDVLKWMALGKSNADIADILGISKHTTNTYVRRIFLKLGVYERVSASLRAISMGLA